MRKNMQKLWAKLAGGALIAMLVISSTAVSFATPSAPTQPDPTDCADCQTIQDDLDAAYAELNSVVTDVSVYGAEIESLLDQTTTTVYEGDSLLMVDQLTSAVADNMLAMGPVCEDQANSFAYYSSFSYEGELYCFLDENMWFGVEPDYFNFLSHMAVMTEGWDVDLSMSWTDVWNEMIELLRDHDSDSSPNIEDLLAEIDTLLTDLADCEEENCPAEVVCPDCEAIADELSLALTDIEDLEAEADIMDQELSDIESDIADVEDQMQDLQTLQDELRAMVEDAGGMTDEACDNFEVGPGQAWGIAHNFGDVQWCFTSESQIEEMINNLDEYWQTHSSQHLPSEAELNAQMDTLMDDYILALDDYATLLDELNVAYADAEALAAELNDCLTELADLQDQGFCLDQNISPLEDLLSDADDVLGTGYQPEPDAEEEPADEPAEEEPAEEEPAGDAPGDIGDHWAEDFITELFNAGVVSGDDETGNYRPNDPVNRAEAAKIVSLANGDEPAECDGTYFPDVEEGSWYCVYTTNAFDSGYFSGYEDGTFGPGNPILRAEAAAVVLRALGFDVPEYTEYSFPDITGDEWYADYAERAYSCGLFEGRDVNGVKMFAGGEEITRAELAKIVYLALFMDMDETACGNETTEE